MTTRRYLVQEFAAGHWYTVRSFESKSEADACAQQLGRKARVVLVEV